ncbi:hypothetical protein CWC48_08225 [Pseudomonas sp. S10E 269]|nr:hypothetical protein CWC49_18385 [Pseudomonas sp. S09F 262]PJK39123.1 hypothetical protein CWC48_08225 [Pseudomonas sp. S10E 269]
MEQIQRLECRTKCGSWLACDAGDSVCLIHRGDAIAGKPAPTLIAFQTQVRAAFQITRFPAGYAAPQIAV